MFCMVTLWQHPPFEGLFTGRHTVDVHVS